MASPRSPWVIAAMAAALRSTGRLRGADPAPWPAKAKPGTGKRAEVKARRKQRRKQRG